VPTRTKIGRDEPDTLVYSRRMAKARIPGRLAELTRARLLAPVMSDEGVVISAGSVGTIVATWRDGAAYEVEFGGLVVGLATVEAALLGPENDGKL
jgi:hypothetical protein